MKTKIVHSFVVLTMLLVLFAGHSIAAPVTAAALATITVDTATDELNADGDCSLREAIQAANTDTAVDACPAGSGADTIIVPAGTYTLTIPGVGDNTNATGDLDILADLTIAGSGAEDTILDANGLDRALHVMNGVNTAINGLTVTGGNVDGYGGGIDNYGSNLYLSDCVITGNAATADGGGIVNITGVITVTNCVISDNTSTYAGGGIANYSGQATISDSLVSENSATSTSGGSGGGIANRASTSNATMTVTNCDVISNTAGNGGGGLGNLFENWTATMTIERTTIRGNSTVIGGNYLKGLGGGLANFLATGTTSGGGYVTIRDSDISDNHATNGGGIGSTPATASGVVTMQVTVENSTIRNNTAGGSGSQVGNGGGILSMDGTLTLINSTVSGNQANGTGSALSGLGGGLLAGSMSLPGMANVVATTISENTAALAGHGIANANLGGGSTVRFKTSLVAGNGSVNCINSSGVYTSLGYNLEDHNTCGFNQASDQINTSSLLGPLADNGGDTWTYALLTGSPAIEAGSCTDHNATAILTDQRGMLRPQGAACDTGAFEADATPPTVPDLLSPADATITDTTTLSLTWTASADPELDGYLLDFDGTVIDAGEVTAYEVGPLADGVYTWTVASYDTFGFVSAYAPAWTFTVDTYVCSGLTSVDLSLETTGNITIGELVTFTANLSPDEATKPYTYTLDFGDDTTPITATGSSDPLAFDHTFGAAGNFTVTISAWNCAMATPVTDTLAVTVETPDFPVTGLDLSLLTPGTLYVGDPASFSADIAPDEAAKPYTYTLDFGDATAIITAMSSADPLAFDHTFAAAGVYTVTITVWNSAMTTPVTDTVTVTIEAPSYEVYLPIVMRMP